MIPAVVSMAMAVLAIGIIRGETGLQDYRSLTKSQLVLEMTVMELENEVHHLEQEINKVKTSKDYAYKLLKEKYHITAENEQIIFFSN